MTVTDIKIDKIENKKTKLVAHATVTLDDALKLFNIKILEKEEGKYFIAFPSRKIEDRYYSLVEVSNDLYQTISNEIISEYKRINEE